MTGMKKVWLGLGLSAVLTAGFAMAAPADGFTAGTYEATVDSVGGPMTVSVTVSEDRIEEVNVIENHDTDGLCDAALERIPEQIVANQTINVDTVSGATLTSVFMRNAVKEALSQATDDLAP